MNSLVSVIVPVYNVENYLRQCLDSLLSQSYKNIEIIMVDDGSKDTSGKICDEYAEKYKNFFVFHKDNAGLGMARNTGLEHIHGKYVTFLDSDDYLNRDCIKALYEYMVNYQVDMCKGGFKRTDDSGNIFSKREYQSEYFKGEKARLELLPRMIGSSPSQHDSVEMCVCGAIYKADIIKNNNLKFPSERELISEDLVFNIDYMQHANGAYLTNNSDYNYRINLKSLTTSYRPDRFDADKHFYIEVRKKLIELGYNNDTMLRLNRAFFIMLNGCIRQETKTSSKSALEKIHFIKHICSDSLVAETIGCYPIIKLGIKQKIFLKLVNYKQAFLLYVFNCYFV